MLELQGHYQVVQPHKHVGLSNDCATLGDKGLDCDPQGSHLDSHKPLSRLSMSPLNCINDVKQHTHVVSQHVVHSPAAVQCFQLGN